MSQAVNDNSSALHTFLQAYWNQMATDLYPDFNAALDDFCRTEGELAYSRLRSDLVAAVTAGFIRRENELALTRQKPFWRDCGMIVVLEDLKGTGLIDGRE